MRGAPPGKAVDSRRVNHAETDSLVLKVGVFLKKERKKKKKKKETISSLAVFFLHYSIPRNPGSP